jgi:hypothetical protein
MPRRKATRVPRRAARDRHSRQDAVVRARVAARSDEDRAALQWPPPPTWASSARVSRIASCPGFVRFSDACPVPGQNPDRITVHDATEIS